MLGMMTRVVMIGVAAFRVVPVAVVPLTAFHHGLDCVDGDDAKRDGMNNRKDHPHLVSLLPRKAVGQGSESEETGMKEIHGMGS